MVSEIVCGHGQSSDQMTAIIYNLPARRRQLRQHEGVGVSFMHDCRDSIDPDAHCGLSKREASNQNERPRCDLLLHLRCEGVCSARKSVHGIIRRWHRFCLLITASCITWRLSLWKRRRYILTGHDAGQVAWAYERSVRNATCVCGGWNVATPTAGHGYAAHRDLPVHGESPSYKPRLEGHTGRTHSDK